MKTKKAVVLLSGGLDSSTTLYWAKTRGFKCFCLIFDYGQRHRKEIQSAKAIAKKACCPYQVIKIPIPWKGSALLDKRKQLRCSENVRDLKTKIPSTYVPSRNIIFLSFAAAYAESIGSRVIFIGANAIDYSGYPDCRPSFIKAYNYMLREGTKCAIEGKFISIHTPLIRMTKSQIVRLGYKLGVPHKLTWSCYKGAKKPCMACDSCRIRQKGFFQVGKEDPCLI